MKEKKKDIDSLIQGISSILSKNRCSLTDEDIVLLQECKKQLELQKKQPSINWNIILRVIEMLCRFFIFDNIRF